MTPNLLPSSFLLALLGAVAITAPALAQDRTRVDLFKPNGERQGYAIVDEKTGRVDTYDASSRRTGYGKIAPDGRVDLYQPDGTRAGSGRSEKRGR